MAKIVIIDDEPGVVKMLERFLASRGHQTASATDGMRAAQVCSEQRPDLILLDYVLPAASGRMLLDRIRAISFLAAVPVLIITGQPLTEVMALLPDRGLRFIEKPFDMSLLERLINELLGAKAAPWPAAPVPPRPVPPPPPDKDASPDGGTLDLDA